MAPSYNDPDANSSTARQPVNDENAVPHPRIILRSQCLLTELEDGSGVVLNLDTKLYYTLNLTAVEVWKALAAGAADASEVAEHLCSSFDVERGVVEGDVRSVLKTMLHEGLIEERT